jgi:hypothetical protein
MAIAFNCPHCAAAIQVADSASGKKGSCPACKAKVVVPTIPVPPAGAAPAVAPSPPVAEVPTPTPASSGPVVPVFPTQAVPAAPSFPSPPEPAPAAPFPAFDQPASAAPFPDVTGASPPGGIPGAPMVQTPQSSVAARTRRRSKKKRSGTIFALLCGVALTGGVGWLYSNAGPNLKKQRIAYTAEDVVLPRKLVDNAFIEVPAEVRRSVLLYFEENPERLRSQLVETEFHGSSAGLEVQILAGTQSMLYRVPIDSDLRAWYDANLEKLSKPRVTRLKKSLKSFFEGWDVAIRNQTGIEDFLSYRDSVGLNAAVGPLGYHVCAEGAGAGVIRRYVIRNGIKTYTDKRRYPCVYEDDGAIYFLLPRDTKTFRVVGARTDDRQSLFPGEFKVTVRKGKKKPAPVETEPDFSDEPLEMPEKPMKGEEPADPKMKKPMMKDGE